MNRTKHSLYGLLILMLGISACAPPWRGEENNYPVAAIAFFDSTDTPLPLDSLGLDSLQHAETGKFLPLSGYFEEPGLEFDSRLDDRYDLILPLDKSADRSTFVLYRQGTTDTVWLRHPGGTGLGPDLTYDHRFDSVSVERHTFPVLDTVLEVNHPQIYLKLEVQL